MAFLKSSNQVADTLITSGSTDLTADAPPFVQQSARGGVQLGICLDSTMLLNRVITLEGWAIGYDRIEVMCNDKRVPATVLRMPRPDVTEAYPGSAAGEAGFVIVIANAPPGEYGLRCTARGQSRTFAMPLDLDALQGRPHLDKLFSRIEDDGSLVGAIDRSFNLGEGGLLIFGWIIDLHDALQSVKFYSEAGGAIDVTDSFFRIPRLDLVANLKNRYPQVTEMSGFVIRVDQQLAAEDLYGLCFDCGDRGQYWLGEEIATSALPPLQLVKDVLTYIPNPGRMRHSLFELFDRILGDPISAAVSRMAAPKPAALVKQFGSFPPEVDVSIIVPIYGRHDFIRYQMARFHADTEFTRIDLIYVIDDPDILGPVMELAAWVYELYGLPFRVVSYNRNLGFAGANNLGAEFATAPLLLLLNSDVIPQQPGWVGSLAASLDDAEVGAVGPLLQFYDGSVQHAGMAPNESPVYPGFIFNGHPGKGGHWAGSDEPFEVPLLTAACLMLRTADYHSIGGFDEGYVIGDFEDSDMCLKLRHRGLKLMLNPGPRLYHLERQSQNLQEISSYRHLLTLYNGWRYTKKIMNGEIANPKEVA